MLTEQEIQIIQELIPYIDIIKQVCLCLLICGAKILEVSIQSVKTVFMVKGEKVFAAFLGFIECVIWGLVISSVVTSLSNNMFLLFGYCIGYASGLFLGSVIEDKIALGTSNVQIIVNEHYVEAVEHYLQEHEHGYTVLEGRGAKDKMMVVIMILPRKNVKTIMTEIRALCANKVFMVTSDVSKFTGGYGVRK